MTLPVGLILTVLAVHFVADFILQPRWAARNKSSNIVALLLHIAIYTACLLPFGIGFAIVNGVAHLFVDAITSRVMASCWKAKREWWFFVVLGLDQLAHNTVLIGTLHVSWWMR